MAGMASTTASAHLSRLSRDDTACLRRFRLAGRGRCGRRARAGPPPARAAGGVSDEGDAGHLRSKDGGETPQGRSPALRRLVKGPLQSSGVARDCAAHQKTHGAEERATQALGVPGGATAPPAFLLQIVCNATQRFSCFHVRARKYECTYVCIVHVTAMYLIQPS